MSGGCVYPIVESFIPPETTERCKSLKYLSACKFTRCLKKKENTKYFLKTIPYSLYQYLFETALYDFYINCYDSENISLVLPESLVQLLQKWPYETFILRDLLPYLPPRHHAICSAEMFSSIKDVRPYYCVRDYLRKFYGILVDMIFYYILKTESIAFFIENVKQVDLIGNFGYNTSVQLLKPQNVLKILKRKALVNSVKMKLKTFQNNVLKKKTLNSQECSKKIEVIIGVGLYSSDEIIAMHNIMDVNIMQPGSDVIVNYQRVIMNFTPPPWEKLTQILFANRAHSLRLIYVGRDDPSTFDVICEGLPHLSDLSVIGSPIPYLKCFNKLSHLQHLSLVGKGLRIQLKHLSSLPSGLTYLKLVDCELYDDDLDFIALSHHAGTLRQLGISNSRFSEPSVSSGNPDGGLIGLCQHLTSLTVLQINWSDLHLWSANGLQKLMNAIKDLPQLVLLDLLRLNIFTEDQLLMQISCLGASSSLKVIHLEYPRNVVESGMNAFKLKFYNALQSTRSEKDLHINLGFHKLSLLTYLTNIPH